MNVYVCIPLWLYKLSLSTSDLLGFHCILSPGLRSSVKISYMCTRHVQTLEHHSVLAHWTQLFMGTDVSCTNRLISYGLRYLFSVVSPTSSGHQVITGGDLCQKSTDENPPWSGSIQLPGGVKVIVVLCNTMVIRIPGHPRALITNIYIQLLLAALQSSSTVRTYTYSVRWCRWPLGRATQSYSSALRLCWFYLDNATDKVRSINGLGVGVWGAIGS